MLATPTPTESALTPVDTNGIDPRTYLIVTIVICTLSVIGSLGVVVPFVVSPAWRRLRHRLIVGLAVSDAAIALSILIPSIEALLNEIEDDASCVAEGFFYLISIFGATFSTLGIAVCTYALLMHPLSRFVDIVSKPLTPLVMFAVFWAVGALITGVSYGVYGFQRSALTICFYGDNSGEFQNIILLLPRCIVFLAVIMLYVTLACHYRRVGRTIVVSEFDESMPANPPEHAFSPLDHESRRGSAATGTDTSGAGSSEKPHAIFGAWSFADRGEDRKESKDSTTHLIQSQSPKSRYRPTLPRFLSSGSGSRGKVPTMKELNKVGPGTTVAWTSTSPADVVPPSSPFSSPRPGFLPPDEVTARVAPVRVNSRSLGHDVIQTSPKHSPPLETSRIDESDDSEKLESPVPEKTSAPPPASPQRAMLSLSRATSRSVHVGPPPFSPTNLALALSRSLSRTQYNTASLSPPPLRAPPIPSAQAIVAAGDAARRRASHSGFEPDDSDVLGMAAALHDDGPVDTPKGRRMSAQEMNRKASVMMTLYPLSYIVLFSVSIARLGTDIRNGVAHPNSVLAVLSKWFIYASGLVDCLIFLVIEGGVRRLIRQG